PADQLAKARAAQEGVSTTDFPQNLFAIPRRFDAPAAIWIAEMLIVTFAVPLLLRELMPAPATTAAPRWKMILQSRWTWFAGAAIVIIAMVCWPWMLARNRAE